MSIILNTTFVVHAPLEADFLKWVEEVYLPAAQGAGVFGTPTVARVLTQIEPDTLSIAVQLPAESLEEAQRWHDGSAALLRDDLRARWGERTMHFTTPMEVIPLKPAPDADAAGN